MTLEILRLLGTLGLAGSVLVGCELSNSIDIEGHDREVLFTDARLTYELVGDAPRTLSEDAGPRTTAPLGGIDAEFVQTSGDFDQSIPAGSRVILDDAAFVGPTEIDVDVAVQVVSIQGRGGFRHASGVGIEFSGGVGFQRVDLEVEAGGRSDREIIGSVGPLVGIRLSFEPIDGFQFYGRGSYTIAYGDDDAVTLGALETGIRVRPVRAIAVYAGWRWWELEIERDGFQDDFVLGLFDVNTSDIEVELSGPLVGIEILF